MKNLLANGELLTYVLDAMTEGVFILDDELRIQYLNESAQQILSGLGIDGIHRNELHVGTPFFDYIQDKPSIVNNAQSTIVNVLETGKPYFGGLRLLSNGKTVRINSVPLSLQNGSKRGVMITGQDVTEMLALEEELDMAFALTLPNSKVENKLRHTVEYQDEYNPETHHIRITGVIQNGLYRHVVNSLKILSSLAAQGITKIIGIEKDQLVQAIIFHDLGKSQPELNVGDVVDPKEVFENGKLHAFRGAEIAKHYYNHSDDVVEIIRYHHHRESELPDSFPWRLLPMFRLFQLIDGLSAAVTRGDVQVEFFVSDNVVHVTEQNRRPQYNGSWTVNLYTGERKKLKLVCENTIKSPEI